MNGSELENETAPVESDVASEMPSSTGEETSQLRARLTRQFQTWLDEMLADEPPPQGIAPNLLDQNQTAGGTEPDTISAGSGQTDLYTLFSALTSLSGEIRLQGRAFKQLTEVLTPTAELPALINQLTEAQHASVGLISQSIEETLANSTEQERSLTVSDGQIGETMIDLYDRLARGLITIGNGIKAIQAAQNNSWLWRLAGGAHFAAQAAMTTQSLRDACAMTLARLEAAMQDWGIQRIGKAGEPFDPQYMTAVDVRNTAAAPPGTVVEVIRSGFALNGTVEAMARVAVSQVKSENRPSPSQGNLGPSEEE